MKETEPLQVLVIFKITIRVGNRIQCYLSYHYLVNDVIGNSVYI